MKDTFLDGVLVTVSIIILLITVIAVVLHEIDLEESETITRTVCISLDDYTALTTKE